MSKRREVKERLGTLDEINGIMSAMKNLALLETRKLAVFLSTQRRAVSSIEATAQDFLSFFPPNATSSSTTLQHVWIIIGSERGFCGDFNESLVQAMNADQPQENTLLLAIGNKLETKLQEDEHIAAFIEGHSVVEEVQMTLLRLTEVLNKLPHIGSVSAIYYDDATDEVRRRQLLPLATPTKKQTDSHPPQLNLQPAEFLSQLTDQYLYAVLHEVFYSALMVENRMRQAHMDKAIRRLEKDESELRLRYNRLRQEEITEEIEIIMLSAEALSDVDEAHA